MKLDKISVIGVGRVGLPLSLSFAEAGFTVYGIDIDNKLIDKLKNGELPFKEKGASELLKKHINKNFFPTLDYSKIKDSKYIIVTLGTPVDEHLNPDYGQIDSLLPILKENLTHGSLIALRSTVSPGTTEFIKHYLEKNTNLKSGRDFYIAFCPERIAQGNYFEEIQEVPQIIGGMDKQSSVKAQELFSKITKECILSDAKSAELAKIFTNMYRYINFAIANEFAILSMEHNRNIYEILELINRNYKRGGVPQPGFTAGPCLYKDGFFVLNNVPFNDLISVSWRINENLPLYLIEKIKKETYLRDKKVAILGLGFKKNIDDTRNSLSFKIKKAFIREHCKVVMHDPYIKRYNNDIEKILKDAKVVIIAINHDEYHNLSRNFLRKYVADNCIVCDIWNIANGGEIIYKL